MFAPGGHIDYNHRDRRGVGLGVGFRQGVLWIERLKLGFFGESECECCRRSLSVRVAELTWVRFYFF